MSELSCPVCGSAKRENRFEIAYPQGISTELWRCVRCDYHFVSPPPPAEFLRSFYDSGYCSHVATLDGWRHTALVERVRRIEKYHAPPGKLLDVGCGNGNFCLVAQGRGWDVFGIEPSAVAVERAFPEVRPRLQVGLLADASFPESTFDVVTFWAVVEHLADPASDLERAVRLLKRNGVLVLQFPNIRSLAARVYAADWRLISNSPDHLGFMTETTIKYLCERFDLTRLSTRFSGLPFPLGSRKRQRATSPNNSEESTTRRSVSLSSRVLQRPGLSRMARSAIHTLRLGDDVELVLRKN